MALSALSSMLAVECRLHGTAVSADDYRPTTRIKIPRMFGYAAGADLTCCS